MWWNSGNTNNKIIFIAPILARQGSLLLIICHIYLFAIHKHIAVKIKKSHVAGLLTGRPAFSCAGVCVYARVFARTHARTHARTEPWLTRVIAP